MSSNILIVESNNDKYFLQAIIRYLNFNIEVAPPIILSEDDYRSMNGLNQTKLKDALKDLKADIQKGEIERVGIVIDIDDKGERERINFINECIQEVFPGSPLLTKVKQYININFDGFNIQLACYFTNVDGKGELETVLRNIKSKNSDYADCLESWKNCLNDHGQEITIKDFDKFWVSIYLRFDTCSKRDKKQAERKCSFEYAMEKKAEIWDFEHPTLNNLKEFLQMFT
ncbi:hypothetical protein A0J48_011000 [Sphaerospermopsis aphanizomenoides BCCUSP55]|uniref:DUF3226 domain-containing protein n=1 Tax=Sphaerospermopsis aphanizomenoides TaxID=459663 RepID=UPI001904ECFF|nr:DUF3226 domain-containing protein [Sphaerospermopsis aphanizomenoides]MBK1988060.1 hypothetical protein [Sphaerospermopsis aphanizomenoides BCCUSP55]